jgi:hypothetical protein
MTTALELGEWSAARPNHTLPLGKTWCPLYRRLGGPQGWSGQVQKISPPIGIRSPDRPARSQSLYRLSYPAHVNVDGKVHCLKYWKLLQMCTLLHTKYLMQHLIRLPCVHTCAQTHLRSKPYCVNPHHARNNCARKGPRHTTVSHFVIVNISRQQWDVNLICKT